METVTKIPLGRLIQLAASDGASPGDIADVVIAAMRPDDYTTYLRELIIARVSSEVGRFRREVTPRQISTKQRLIRDEYWPRFLQQKVSLPGGLKTLAEATSDDLRFLANVRRSQAAELAMRADQFDQLANLMDKSRVRRLEQLDPSAGNGVLAAA